jgi:hypothetical protein
MGESPTKGGFVRRWITFGICGGPLLLLFILSVNTEAIPTFARKYQTSCSTCHYAFPKLNKFGRAYSNNGLRYPGDDKDYAKEEAVSLGSDAQKKVFPNAIWPADIPGQTPVSFRWISRMHYQPDEKGNEFTFENPHEFEVFTAGTIGDDMSFFFELEWEHVGEFGYGGWLDYKFSDPFHLRLGNIDFMPFHDGQRLTREHYNYGVFAEKEGDGILLWGAANGPSDKGGEVLGEQLPKGSDSKEPRVCARATAPPRRLDGRAVEDREKAQPLSGLRWQADHNRDAVPQGKK